jgi:hypothetical protein
MMPPPSTANQPVPNSWALFATKATILLLLFTVAGLATLAKNGQYYPKSNPAKYVSISTKMNVVVQPSAHLNNQQLQPTTRFSPPHPQFPLAWVQPLQPPAVRTISVTVSMQHRSPPFAVSSRLFLAAVNNSTI